MEKENKTKGRMNESQLQNLFHLRRIGPPATKDGVLDVLNLHKVTSLFGRNKQQVDFLLDSSNNVASQYISRLHARIVRQENNNHRIFDDSLNGIFINNTKIQGSVVLREGDVVTFGHPYGVRLAPGVWKRQPDSEYQFIFETCNCSLSKSNSRTEKSAEDSVVKQTKDRQVDEEGNFASDTQEIGNRQNKSMKENSNSNRSLQMDSKYMQDTFVSNVSFQEASSLGKSDEKDVDICPLSPCIPLLENQNQSLTTKDAVIMSPLKDSDHASFANAPQSTSLSQSVARTNSQTPNVHFIQVAALDGKSHGTQASCHMENTQCASNLLQDKENESVSVSAKQCDDKNDKIDEFGFSDSEENGSEFSLRDIAGESVLRSVLELCHQPSFGNNNVNLQTENQSTDYGSTAVPEEAPHAHISNSSDGRLTDISCKKQSDTLKTEKTAEENVFVTPRDPPLKRGKRSSHQKQDERQMVDGWSKDNGGSGMFLLPRNENMPVTAVPISDSVVTQSSDPQRDTRDDVLKAGLKSSEDVWKILESISDDTVVPSTTDLVITVKASNQNSETETVTEDVALNSVVISQEPTSKAANDVADADPMTDVQNEALLPSESTKKTATKAVNDVLDTEPIRTVRDETLLSSETVKKPVKDNIPIPAVPMNTSVSVFSSSSEYVPASVDDVVGGKSSKLKAETLDMKCTIDKDEMPDASPCRQETAPLSEAWSAVPSSPEPLSDFVDDAPVSCFHSPQTDYPCSPEPMTEFMDNQVQHSPELEAEFTAEEQNKLFPKCATEAMEDEQSEMLPKSEARPQDEKHEDEHSQESLTTAPVDSALNMKTLFKGTMGASLTETVEVDISSKAAFPSCKDNMKESACATGTDSSSGLSSVNSHSHVLDTHEVIFVDETVTSNVFNKHEVIYIDETSNPDVITILNEPEVIIVDDASDTDEAPVSTRSKDVARSLTLKPLKMMTRSQTRKQMNWLLLPNPESHRPEKESLAHEHRMKSRDSVKSLIRTTLAQEHVPQGTAFQDTLSNHHGEKCAEIEMNSVEKLKISENISTKEVKLLVEEQIEGEITPKETVMFPENHRTAEEISQNKEMSSENQALAEKNSPNGKVLPSEKLTITGDITVNEEVLPNENLISAENILQNDDNSSENQTTEGISSNEKVMSFENQIAENTSPNEENPLENETTAEDISQNEENLLENQTTAENTSPNEENPLENQTTAEDISPNEENPLENQTTAENISPSEEMMSFENQITAENTSPNEENPLENQTTAENTSPNEENPLENQTTAEDISPNEENPLGNQTTAEDISPNEENLLENQTIETTAEDISPNEENLLENQTTAEDISPNEEKSLENQTTAEDNSPNEKVMSLENQTTAEDISPNEENPLENQTTAEDISPNEEVMPIAKQTTAENISSNEENPLENQTTAEDISPNEVMPITRQTTAEDISPNEEVLPITRQTTAEDISPNEEVMLITRQTTAEDISPNEEVMLITKQTTAENISPNEENPLENQTTAEDISPNEEVMLLGNQAIAENTSTNEEEMSIIKQILPEGTSPNEVMPLENETSTKDIIPNEMMSCENQMTAEEFTPNEEVIAFEKPKTAEEVISNDDVISSERSRTTEEITPNKEVMSSEDQTTAEECIVKEELFETKARNLPESHEGMSIVKQMMLEDRKTTEIMPFKFETTLCGYTPNEEIYLKNEETPTEIIPNEKAMALENQATAGEIIPKEELVSFGDQPNATDIISKEEITALESLTTVSQIPQNDERIVLENQSMPREITPKEEMTSENQSASRELTLKKEMTSENQATSGEITLKDEITPLENQKSPSEIILTERIMSPEKQTSEAEIASSKEMPSSDNQNDTMHVDNQTNLDENISNEGSGSEGNETIPKHCALNSSLTSCKASSSLKQAITSEHHTMPEENMQTVSFENQTSHQKCTTYNKETSDFEETRENLSKYETVTSGNKASHDECAQNNGSNSTARQTTHEESTQEAVDMTVDSYERDLLASSGEKDGGTYLKHRPTSNHMALNLTDSDSHYCDKTQSTDNETQSAYKDESKTLTLESTRYSPQSQPLSPFSENSESSFPDAAVRGQTTESLTLSTEAQKSIDATRIVNDCVLRPHLKEGTSAMEGTDFVTSTPNESKSSSSDVKEKQFIVGTFLSPISEGGKDTAIPNDPENYIADGQTSASANMYGNETTELFDVTVVDEGDAIDDNTGDVFLHDKTQNQNETERDEVTLTGNDMTHANGVTQVVTCPASYGDKSSGVNVNGRSVFLSEKCQSYAKEKTLIRNIMEEESCEFASQSQSSVEYNHEVNQTQEVNGASDCYVNQGGEMSDKEIKAHGHDDVINDNTDEQNLENSNGITVEKSEENVLNDGVTKLDEHEVDESDAADVRVEDNGEIKSDERTSEDRIDDIVGTYEKIVEHHEQINDDDMIIEKIDEHEQKGERFDTKSRKFNDGDKQNEISVDTEDQDTREILPSEGFAGDGITNVVAPDDEETRCVDLAEAEETVGNEENSEATTFEVDNEPSSYLERDSLKVKNVEGKVSDINDLNHGSEANIQDCFVVPQDQVVTKLASATFSKTNDGNDFNQRMAFTSVDEEDHTAMEEKWSGSSLSSNSLLEFKDEDELHLYWSQASSGTSSSVNEVPMESESQASANSQMCSTNEGRLPSPEVETCRDVLSPGRKTSATVDDLNAHELSNKPAATASYTGTLLNAESGQIPLDNSRSVSEDLKENERMMKRANQLETNAMTDLDDHVRCPPTEVESEMDMPCTDEKIYADIENNGLFGEEKTDVGCALPFVQDKTAVDNAVSFAQKNSGAQKDLLFAQEKSDIDNNQPFVQEQTDLGVVSDLSIKDTNAKNDVLSTDHEEVDSEVPIKDQDTNVKNDFLGADSQEINSEVPVQDQDTNHDVLSTDHQEVDSEVPIEDQDANAKNDILGADSQEVNSEVRVQHQDTNHDVLSTDHQEVNFDVAIEDQDSNAKNDVLSTDHQEVDSEVAIEDQDSNAKNDVLSADHQEVDSDVAIEDQDSNANHDVLTDHQEVDSDVAIEDQDSNAKNDVLSTDHQEVDSDVAIEDQDSNAKNDVLSTDHEEVDSDVAIEDQDTNAKNDVLSTDHDEVDSDVAIKDQDSNAKNHVFNTDHQEVDSDVAIKDQDSNAKNDVLSTDHEEVDSDVAIEDQDSNAKNDVLSTDHEEVDSDVAIEDQGSNAKNDVLSTDHQEVDSDVAIEDQDSNAKNDVLSTDHEEVDSDVAIEDQDTNAKNDVLSTDPEEVDSDVAIEDQDTNTKNDVLSTDHEEVDSDVAIEDQDSNAKNDVLSTDHQEVDSDVAIEDQDSNAKNDVLSTDHEEVDSDVAIEDQDSNAKNDVLSTDHQEVDSDVAIEDQGSNAKNDVLSTDHQEVDSDVAIEDQDSNAKNDVLSTDHEEVDSDVAIEDQDTNAKNDVLSTDPEEVDSDVAIEDQDSNAKNDVLSTDHEEVDSDVAIEDQDTNAKNDVLSTDPEEVDSDVAIEDQDTNAKNDVLSTDHEEVDSDVAIEDQDSNAKNDVLSTDHQEIDSDVAIKDQDSNAKNDVLSTDHEEVDSDVAIEDQDSNAKNDVLSTDHQEVDSEKLIKDQDTNAKNDVHDTDKEVNTAVPIEDQANNNNVLSTDQEVEDHDTADANNDYLSKECQEVDSEVHIEDHETDTNNDVFDSEQVRSKVLSDNIDIDGSNENLGANEDMDSDVHNNQKETEIIGDNLAIKLNKTEGVDNAPIIHMKVDIDNVPNKIKETEVYVDNVPIKQKEPDVDVGNVSIEQNETDLDENNVTIEQKETDLDKNNVPSEHKETELDDENNVPSEHKETDLDDENNVPGEQKETELDDENNVPSEHKETDLDDENKVPSEQKETELDDENNVPSEHKETDLDDENNVPSEKKETELDDENNVPSEHKETELDDENKFPSEQKETELDDENNVPGEQKETELDDENNVPSEHKETDLDDENKVPSEQKETELDDENNVPSEHKETDLDDENNVPSEQKETELDDENNVPSEHKETELDDENKFPSEQKETELDDENNVPSEHKETDLDDENNVPGEQKETELDDENNVPSEHKETDLDDENNVPGKQKETELDDENNVPSEHKETDLDDENNVPGEQKETELDDENNVPSEHKETDLDDENNNPSEQKETELDDEKNNPSEQKETDLDENNVPSEQKEIDLDENNVPSEQKEIDLNENNVPSEEKEIDLDENNVPSEQKETDLDENNVPSEQKETDLDENNVPSEQKETELEIEATKREFAPRFVSCCEDRQISRLRHNNSQPLLDDSLKGSVGKEETKTHSQESSSEDDFSLSLSSSSSSLSSVYQAPLTSTQNDTDSIVVPNFNQSSSQQNVSVPDSANTVEDNVSSFKDEENETRNQNKKRKRSDEEDFAEKRPKTETEINPSLPSLPLSDKDYDAIDSIDINSKMTVDKLQAVAVSSVHDDDSISVNLSQDSSSLDVQTPDECNQTSTADIPVSNSGKEVPIVNADNQKPHADNLLKHKSNTDNQPLSEPSTSSNSDGFRSWSDYASRQSPAKMSKIGDKCAMSPDVKSTPSNPSQNSSQLSPGECFDIAEHRRKRKREKLHAAIVNELVNLNKEIRTALSKDDPNISKAVSALEDVEDLPINESILKTYPAILETVSKCRKYKGNEEVCRISKDIHAKFQSIIKENENKRPRY